MLSTLRFIAFQMMIEMIAVRERDEARHREKHTFLDNKTNKHMMQNYCAIR